MANRKIYSMVIRQMIKLKMSSYSNRKIATELDLHRNTVNGYIQKIIQSGKSFQQLYDLSDADLSSIFEVEKQPSDRHKQLLAFFTEVLKEKSRPGFTFQNIWQEYKVKHQEAYSYSQFMAYYNQWSIKDKATLKLHHVAGDKLMVAYA